MKLLPFEIWKDIPGFDGFQSSSMGNVRTLNWRHTGRTHQLKPVNHKGYLRVWVTLNGKGSFVFVHRLVAITFLPNPNGLPQINHKDENPLNNQVSNLEWCDAKYNSNYGNHKENIRNGMSHKPVLCIKNGKVVKEYLSAYYASLETGICRMGIVKCCNKTNWRKTAGGYEWKYKK